MKTITSFNRLLLLFFAFIGVMIISRILYAGNMRYLFLVWNLFLGWIPYVLSGLFIHFVNRDSYRQLLLFISWLLFFPNALYIITDLIHLQQETMVPLWYDVILLFAASFIGLVMAFLSLQRVETFLGNIFSPKAAGVMIPFILFLGSFGVYLGRFQRWNSWDVINDPLALGLDIFTMILSPQDNFRTWLITFILTALYSLLYIFIKMMPRAFSETNPTGDGKAL